LRVTVMHNACIGIGVTGVSWGTELRHGQRLAEFLAVANKF